MRSADGKGMQASLPLQDSRPWTARAFPNGEWILLVGLALEIAVFAAIAPSFFTAANFFEVVRLSVELGLLALALTPVMITGGIDLSVGSMMGLAAGGVGGGGRGGGARVRGGGAGGTGPGGAGGAVDALPN